MKAHLKFLTNLDEPLVYLPSKGGGDQTDHVGNFAMQEVNVHDGRRDKSSASLDVEGFKLVSQKTTVEDFYDDVQVESTYHEEVKSLLKDVTGAARIEIFDDTRRSSSLEQQRGKNIREPADIVHNDYTANFFASLLLKGRKELVSWLSGGPTVGTERIGYLGQVYFLAELNDDDDAVQFIQSLRDYMANWLDSLRAVEKTWHEFLASLGRSPINTTSWSDSRWVFLACEQTFVIHFLQQRVNLRKFSAPEISQGAIEAFLEIIATVRLAQHAKHDMSEAHAVSPNFRR